MPAVSIGQRAVEPGRVALLVAKLDSSRTERRKRRPPREHSVTATGQP